MVLYKLEDFNPNYQDAFGSDAVKGFDVYANNNDEKIGTVKDILVDEEGRFRYLVVNMGFWVFGKEVLLPIGRTKIAPQAKRVRAVGLTKEQVENLPEFKDNLKVDYDYEERVRGIYRNSAVDPYREASQSVTASASLDNMAPVDLPPISGTSRSNNIPADQTAAYNRDTYTYQQDPSLYQMNDGDHQTLRLYEERLVANKQRVKAGEVAVGKHIETQTAQVAVPLEKERVIIERTTPVDAGRVVSPSADAFREGKLTHVDIYEERPDIHKETFVREEVRVKKVVDHDTATAEEQIRREELDIDTQGSLDVNKRG